MKKRGNSNLGGESALDPMSGRDRPKSGQALVKVSQRQPSARRRGEFLLTFSMRQMRRRMPGWKEYSDKRNKERSLWPEKKERPYKICEQPKAQGGARLEESKGRPSSQASKEVPQPQVCLALGLMILKPVWVNSSS